MTKEQIQALALVAVEAIAAAAELAERRDHTRHQVVAAIRRIEQALERIRHDAGLPAFSGLPNLGQGHVTLRGLNVRAKDLAKQLDRPGWRGGNRPPAAALVLAAHGKLQVAQLSKDGDLALGVRECEDADLQLDDIELVAEAAAELLRLQRDVAGTKGEILRSAQLLAGNLDAALVAWDDGDDVAVQRRLPLEPERTV